MAIDKDYLKVSGLKNDIIVSNGNVIGTRSKSGVETFFQTTTKEDGGIATSLITSSRSTLKTDDKSIAANNTSNNYTITIEGSTIPNGMVLQQLSTGTVNAEQAASGITVIGLPLTTANQGDQIFITPSPVDNTLIATLVSA